MKLFGRTGGYYLFWTGFVYFWVGMSLAFMQVTRPEIATAVWICVLALPFVIPPIGRYFNLDVEWDKRMFDFFKSRKEREEEYNNVVKFPAPVPQVEPPVEPEKPAKIFYRIGATDQNRVAFSMGQMEITMNKQGCQQMIDQLTVFMNQIDDTVDN
jgi:hypothetical protein